MSIFVITLFLIAPFLTIPLIIVGILKDKKHYGIYAFLLATLFAIIAYNFEPNNSQDLYRYYYLMREYYGPMNIGEYISVMFQNNKILFELLCYIISQTANLRLLPFICTLIGYFIAFYIIMDFARIKEISSSKTLLVIFAFICIYYHINFISGLAQFLAINIAVLAFYLEYIKNKKGIIYKMLYIIPIFIHISLLILIIVRILLNFNYNKVRKVIIPIFLIYGTNPMIVFKFLEIFKNNILLSVLISKSNMYLLENSHIWESTYGIGALLLIIFFIIIFYTNIKPVKLIMNDKICNFTEIMLLFIVSSSLYFDIFMRFSNIVLMLMSIYMLIVLNINKKTKKMFIIITVIIFSMLMGSVNLNNFKYNDFNNLFSNMAENIIYYLK